MTSKLLFDLLLKLHMQPLGSEPGRESQNLAAQRQGVVGYYFFHAERTNTEESERKKRFFT